MELKKYKKGIIGIFIFAFICAIFSTLSESNIESQNDKKETLEASITENKTDSEDIITMTIEPTEKPTQEPTQEPTAEPTEIKLSLELGVIILKDSYGDTATIEVDKDNNCINIIPTDSLIFMTEYQLAKDGNKEYINNWEVLVDSIVEYSKGLEDDIIISLVNPLNKDNTLLMVIGGSVGYNSIND